MCDHKCDKCILMQEKLKVYEECNAKINELNKQNCEPDFKLKSYILIDKQKNMTELNKKEHDIILEQDNYHDYVKVKKYKEKFGSVYAFASYAFGFVRLLF